MRGGKIDVAWPKSHRILQVYEFQLVAESKFALATRLGNWRYVASRAKPPPNPHGKLRGKPSAFYRF